MNWMDICTHPGLINSTTSLVCSEWCDDTENNIWTSLDGMNYDQVLAWQYCINKRFGLEDSVTSRWLKEIPASHDALHRQYNRSLGGRLQRYGVERIQKRCQQLWHLDLDL